MGARRALPAGSAPQEPRGRMDGALWHGALHLGRATHGEDESDVDAHQLLPRRGDPVDSPGPGPCPYRPGRHRVVDRPLLRPPGHRPGPAGGRCRSRPAGGCGRATPTGRTAAGRCHRASPTGHRAAQPERSSGPRPVAVCWWMPGLTCGSRRRVWCGCQRRCRRRLPGLLWPRVAGGWRSRRLRRRAGCLGCRSSG